MCAAGILRWFLRKRGTTKAKKTEDRRLVPVYGVELLWVVFGAPLRSCAVLRWWCRLQDKSHQVSLENLRVGRALCVFTRVLLLWQYLTLLINARCIDYYDSRPSSDTVLEKRGQDAQFAEHHFRLRLLILVDTVNPLPVSL